MNTTLRERIERMRMSIIARRDQLERNIEEYKRDEHWERVMVNDIKLRQFNMFIEAVDEALSKP